MLRRRLAPLLLVLALVGAAAACGGDDGDKADKADATSTTQVTGTTTPASAEQLALLLTKEDLEAAGFTGTTPSDVNDAPVQQNPDPRGPCGGKVAQPPLQHAFGRTFSSTNVVVVELVTPSGDAQRKFIDALKADAKPGCSPYTSKSTAGGDQKVSDVKILTLDGVDLPAIAWTQQLETGGQKVPEVVLAVVAKGKFAFVQGITAGEMTEANATKLVTAAITRLQGG